MDAAREVKERLAIEDVVGEYVTLKRSGRNFKGVCPFHQEKTPSFMVNPERGIYHCFGCGEGGDVISFVMKMEGLEFKEVLERLARKAGVDLEQFRSEGTSEQDKERLRKILTLSIRYYQETMLRNQHALDYAQKIRRLNRQTLSDFQIGYAPLERDGLVAFLKRRGHSPKDIKAAGLTARNGQDIFRGRLMIPLSDNQGRPVGFTGRLLDEAAFGPKYLNTPQTMLYDKSRHIFGLAQAKTAIREKASVILVEGNMDVISSHQAGFKQTVATAGTALTIDQVRGLSRLADRLILAFDSDKAGLAATVRAVELAQRLPIKVYVAPISAGKDPDELVSNDPAAWERTIENPVYALDWVVHHFADQYDLSSAPGKVAFSDVLLPLLRQIADPVEQEHYLTQVASHLDVTSDTMKRKLGAKPVIESSKAKTAAIPAQKDDYRMRLNSLLALLLVYPETRVCLPQLMELPLELTDEQSAVLDALRSDKTDLPESDFFGTILAFRAEELYNAWEPKQRTMEAIELAQRLTHETKRRQLQNISTKIAEAEARGDHDEAARLLQDSKQLTTKE